MFLSACRSTAPCNNVGTIGNVAVYESPKVVTVEISNPDAPKPDVPKPTETPAQMLAKEMIAQLRDKTPIINAFETNTSMNIDTPELQQDANAVIRMNVNEALWASLRPSALNVEVAKSLITADSFFVYNKIEREFIYGNVALAKRYVPIAGTLTELREMLTGSLMPAANETWSAERKGEVVELTNATNTAIYTLDPKIMRVLQFVAKDLQGQVTQVIRFQEHDDFDGFLLPRSIILSQPLEERTVALYHRRFNPNPATLEMDFKINRSGLKVTKVE